MTLRDDLIALDACEDAIEWVGDRDLAAAWAECPRGDWLLWISSRCCTYGDETHRAVVRAAAACARTALHHIPRGELRPLAAIVAAEAWADTAEGAAADAAVIAAARDASYSADDAARAAAYAAHAAHAARAAPNAANAAARAAAHAAHAARAAPNAANAAPNAAAHAAYATSVGAGFAKCDAVDAEVASQRECADIVRRMVPCPGGGA